MALPLVQKPAYSHGGVFAANRPLGVAIHSTESENGTGSAEAIAGPNWFGGPAAGTSAHKVVDQNSICEGVKRNIVAYHAGTKGNSYYIAYEFCGRASWSAAKWREAPQMAMLRNAAPHIAADLRYCGAAARWLSVVQVAQLQRGLLTHNDIRLAFPGTTTHSDPGPNFPYAELLALVQAELAPVTQTSPTTVVTTAEVKLAFPVGGSIAAAWVRNGALQGPGQPKGPEVPTADKVGRWQEFANGIILWHPTVDKGTAHLIKGEILKTFRMLGSETVTGYPLTDETATPDGRGRFNHFEKLSIYWSPTTGAHEIKGAIKAKWAELGYEKSKLGYPTGPEVIQRATDANADGDIMQLFERGSSITWDGATATVHIP